MGALILRPFFVRADVVEHVLGLVELRGLFRGRRSGLFLAARTQKQKQNEGDSHSVKVSLWPSTKKGPPRRTTLPSGSVKSSGLVGRVVRRVGDRVLRVLDRVAGVLDGVARRVQRVVGDSRRVLGSDVGVIRRIVLDRRLVRGVGVGIVLVARGKAERDDRNGQDRNLLHELSTPFKSALGDASPSPFASRSGQASGNSFNPYRVTRDYFHSLN